MSLISNEVLCEMIQITEPDTLHPDRYGRDTPYECIKVLKNWMSPEEYKGFCRGNAIKYLCRLGKKDDPVKELKKASVYIEFLKEAYENEKETTAADK